MHSTANAFGGSITGRPFATQSCVGLVQLEPVESNAEAGGGRGHGKGLRLRVRLLYRKRATTVRSKGRGALQRAAVRSNAGGANESGIEMRMTSRVAMTRMRTMFRVGCWRSDAR